MYEDIKKNWDKIKIFILFAIVTIFFLIITIAYKNINYVNTSFKKVEFQGDELEKIKNFLFEKINSPFINTDYIIQKGDSIQLILKKFKVRNADINNIISQYKK